MAARGMADWPWNGDEVDTLPRAERLLLDAFRCWHQAAAQGHAVLPALRNLLVAEAAQAIAPALDALLRLAPMTGIACPLCPRVTQDEAALLLLCALAQRGARSEALAAALRLLPLRSAYAALPAVIMIGAELRSLGLLLQNPLRQAVRPPALRG